LKELGNRLKEVRCYLGLSQIELAKKLDCNQVIISRLEVGKGSIKSLVSLLAFYSQYIYINYIFADKFYLISTDDKDVSRSNLDSIVSSIVTESIKQYEKETKEITEKMKNSLDKAVGLLNG
jgi:predicted transcriptional regulator